MTHRVFCVGETMAMVSASARAPLAEAVTFTIAAGGAESNVACHLAALGVDTVWLSRLGDDALGDRVAASLLSLGVDVSFVTRDPDSSTGVYFKDSMPGARRPVTYYRADSAASRMGVDDLERWPMAEATWVHVSGITAALSSSCSRLVERIVDDSLSLGYGVSFDVNYRPALWWNRDVAAARALELGRRCTVVLVGLDEAQELWDVATAEDVGDLFASVPAVVVKDGALEAVEIAHFKDSPRRVVRVPAQPVDIVEAIGAGDAFAAGFLAGYLRDDDPADRLAAGHRLAAWTMGGLGDHRPMVHHADIRHTGIRSVPGR